MSNLYFLLIPLFLSGVFIKSKEISKAINEKNSVQIKVNSVFLFLMLIVASFMVFVIERV